MLRRLDKRAEFGPVRDVGFTGSRRLRIVESYRTIEERVQRGVRELRIAQVLVGKSDRVRHLSQLRLTLDDVAQVAHYRGGIPLRVEPPARGLWPAVASPRIRGHGDEKARYRRRPVAPREGNELDVGGCDEAFEVPVPIGHLLEPTECGVGVDLEEAVDQLL